MTNNFTPAKAGQQRSRLSKEEYIHSRVSDELYKKKQERSKDYER